MLLNEKYIYSRLVTLFYKEKHKDTDNVLEVVVVILVQKAQHIQTLSLKWIWKKVCFFLKL